MAATPAKVIDKPNEQGEKLLIMGLKLLKEVTCGEPSIQVFDMGGTRGFAHTI